MSTDMVLGIHHVSMKCDAEEDLPRVRTFYETVLGLRVWRVWSEGLLLDTGGGYLEIFTTGKGEERKGAIRHIALAVRNVDALVRRVRLAGYPILIEPKDLFFDSDPPFRARIAFCVGPMGEEIEFMTELPFPDEM